MKECTYDVLSTGQKDISFIELLQYVDEQFAKVLDTNTISKISDIVYSKDPYKDSIITRIGEVKYDYIMTTSRVASTYDDELGGDGSILSYQEFIEDPACLIDGVPLVRPYNKEEFRKREIDSLVHDKGYTEEAATKEVDTHLENMDQFKKDSVVFHKIIDGFGVISTKTKPSDYVRAVSEVVDGTPFEGKTSMLEGIKSQMENFVNQYIYHTQVGPVIIGNVGLKAKIEALGKELVGHIDYLSVDSSGTLHVYNFKASQQTMNNWSKDKWKKYNYGMAFLKQMLAYNGIPVKNIELNIVPVHMTYSEDGDLEKVTIGAPQNISVNRTGDYMLGQYDKHARHFIPSNVSIPKVSIETFDKADELFQNTFPILNMRSEGIHRSAIELIKHAPEAGEAEPLVIREVNDEKGRWEVIIGGKSYRPKSNKNKNINQEILDIVVENLNEIEDDTLQTVHTLKEAIRKMNQVTEHGVYVPESDIIDKLKGLSSSRGFIKTMLDVYFNDIEWGPADPRTGKRSMTYRWKLRDELLDYNIILMENKETGQLDIISLSSFDCNAEIPFGKGRHTLLGAFKTDVQTNTLRGDYGNAEVIRAIILLNQILPTMDMENIKLGRVKVLSHNGNSRNYAIGDITKNYLPEIIDTVSKESDIEFPNNFRNLKKEQFIDPLDAVLYEFALLTQAKGEGQMMEYSPDKFQALADLVGSDEDYKKTVVLKELLNSLYLKLPTKKFDEIARYANGQMGHGNEQKLCRLYRVISDAYHHYTGERLNYEMELTDVYRHMSTTNHIPNQNIRIVTDNLAATYNSIATEVEQYHAKNMRGFIMEFLKAKGYGLAQNATLGNEASLFDNMFERDEQNNKTLRFKNPWTDGSLKPEEAKFLKQALYQFYLIRNKGTDVHGFGSYDSPAIPKFISESAGGFKYLWCPLMRASNSTRVMQNLDANTWKGRAKRVWNVIKNPEQYYDEQVERLTEQERNLIRQGLEADKEKLGYVHNMFDIGDEMDRAGTRQEFIDAQGVDFFETNIENILVEYLSKQVECTKLKDFMIGTRSLLFQLTLMGEESGNSEIMEREIKYIRDFLKVNVFNTTIKSETGRVLTGALAGVRSQVTLMNLGGNMISFFRDVFQGFEENFMRTVTKLNTDIDAKTLSEAYAYVVTHGMTNTMNINLLSKLQTRYRLSNIDLASTESLKVGRGGITNYRNWAYATLRRPDFLNRMTLFVARCMKDGCWEGWEIQDDILIYNWKKDKRFKALVDGTPKDSAEYKQAKALYMSKAREWNAEHPEQQIDLNPETAETFLPAPYSDKEILAVKEVADNIYGAYDKSLKSMGEHTTLMWFFGMYTTWMNGIWNNYFMKPGKYSANRSNVEQQTDEAGNPLFLDEDGGVTTVDTGMPLYHNVPTIVQGIAYTLRDIYYITKDGGLQAMKDYISANPTVRASLAKLLSDMLVTLLLFSIFKFALDPAYKDYKKAMKDNPVIANLATEILYKAGGRSYDSFRGPLNFKDWLGDNTASPMYEVNLKVMQDGLKVVTGRKSVSDAFMGNFAVARAGKDTYAAWKKAQQ